MYNNDLARALLRYSTASLTEYLANTMREGECTEQAIEEALTDWANEKLKEQ